MRLLPEKRSKLRRWLFAFVIFVFLLLFFSLPVIRGGLGAGAEGLGRPLWLARNYLSEKLAVAFGSLRSRYQLVQENRLLRFRLSELQMSLERFAESEQNYQKLREIFGARFENQRVAEPLVARVLARPWQTPYDILIVDLGRGNTTKPIAPGDQVVAAASSYLLGEVDEVFAKTARVKLYSSPETELSVVIGREAVSAMARGRGGGNLEVVLPRGVSIQAGERVTIPQVDGGFWILGEVGGIEKEEGGTFQTLFIRPPVNLNQLQWVEIYEAATT